MVEKSWNCNENIAVVDPGGIKGKSLAFTVSLAEIEPEEGVLFHILLTDVLLNLTLICRTTLLLLKNK